MSGTRTPHRPHQYVSDIELILHWLTTLPLRLANIMITIMFALIFGAVAFGAG